MDVVFDGWDGVVKPEDRVWRGREGYLIFKANLTLAASTWCNKNYFLNATATSPTGRLTGHMGLMAILRFLTLSYQGILGNILQ